MEKVPPKVSIIIPVYNGAKYMREAIQSALSQTYPHVEVIVINDGSTDGGESERIALSYGNLIRYFHKENGGVATALNSGIEQMTGEYFSWLSHDDLYTPDKIERQMEILQNIEHDTILYGGYELVNERSEKFAQVDPGLLYPTFKLDIPMLPLLRGLINGCTLLIHKSHFDRVGLFDPQLRSTQDYDLWYRMFRGAKVKYHSGLFVKSRSHPEQGTNTMPKHEEDCSNLWIYMMDNLTSDEMCEIDGSIYSFRDKTVKFLKDNTSYKKAITHAELLLQEAENELEDIRKEKKVSVIIPFFNRIELLLESIKSVINQSHSNFEILLIDDGTTDDLTLVKELVKKDHRIRYFLQDHKGPSSARNMGIQVAQGGYLAFLDSDDLFEKDKIKIQLEFMIRNGYEFCHTSYQKITNQGEPLEIVNSGLFSGSVFPRILSSCGIATPTVMIKMSIIKDLKFLDDYIIGEDTCFWIDLAFQHALGGLDQVLSFVRVNNMSAAYNLEKQRLGLLNIAAYIIRNPSYVPFERDIYLLLNDLMSLFDRTTEKRVMIPNNRGDGTEIYYIRNSKSRMKRLFISLGHDGYKVTIKKVINKIKLKIFRR